MEMNRTFLINDLNRLRNMNATCKVIKNWKLFSQDNNTAFAEIIDHIHETFSLPNCITDKDAQVIKECLKDNFIESDNNFERKINILSKYSQEEYNKDGSLSIFHNMMSDLKHHLGYNQKMNQVENNHRKLVNKIDVENLMTKTYNMDHCESNATEGIPDVCDNIKEAYSDLDQNKLFGICIENVKYACNKLRIPISDEDILFNITEYFIMQENTNIDLLLSIIENTKIYNEKCKDKTKKILNKIKKEDMLIKDKKNKDSKELEKMGLELPVLEKANVQDIKDLLYNMLMEIKTSKSADNTRKIVKKIENILYKKPVQDIIDDTPHILGFVRQVILYGGSLVINPLLIIPTIIVDVMIHHKVNTKHCNEELKKIESEIKKVNKRIDTVKKDSTKENLNKYKETLEKQKERLETYRDGLKSNMEIEDEYNNTDINREMAIILAMEYYLENNILVENTAVNILRTSREKLKKNFEKLSAKEKTISRNIDTTVQRMENDVMRAVTIKERDKVIKGSILPSASKTIKLAIGTAAAFAIAPAVAVVGSLGAIALSKRANARERQLILDEIDIHLKIVEKKLSQAEMNNDDKAIEELMKLENKLKREKQRIKYRMKVYYDQKV